MISRAFPSSKGFVPVVNGDGDGPGVDGDGDFDGDGPGVDGIQPEQGQVCKGTRQTGLGSCYIFRRHKAFNSQTACA